MIKKAMVVRNQAQFNPLEYVRRLAAAVHSKQCEIFEESAVIEIDEQNGIVRTAAHSVTADHIVVATHTPKGFDVVHTELGPYREYAVAAALDRQPLPGGIFWSVGEQRTSTRAVILNGKRYVLMIGEKHKTGQNENPETSYQHLSDLMLARFDVQDISVKWSAQHYRAADGLPYIGSSAGAALVYIATGFGSDGLTYGTLAGMMIADEINGVDNPFAELYSPRRFTPVKSAKNFLKENLNVAGRYIKDYTRSADVKSFANLMRGEGGLVDAEGDKLAVYRDEFDHLHILSPVCTHLKCIVHWNRAERSWDCPCHGSRFDFDGNIIEGPALFPLQRHNVIADMDFDAPPLT
jgi:Rieske Fe-S protein